ncbi:uncharacterized protein LOC144638723 [Oculina patagonica]
MSLSMGQPAAAAVKVKRSQDGCFSKTVILLKKNDCRRSKDKVYIPNTIEMAKIKKPNTGQYKTKVQFFKEMSEEMVRQKLQETFTTFNLNGRVSCAAVSQDSITFQFYGTPRIWNGKTIKERIKGNSVLYIVMEDDQEPNSENGTSSNTHQGDDADGMSCIVTDVIQMSLLDSSQMEIDDSQQVTPGDRNNNVHQDQLRMSDSSEEGSSSADTSTTSGISGSDLDCTEVELALVRWLEENLNFEVKIRPNKSAPQGGDPFNLTFNPKLHPAVTSGLATFGNVGPVELERSKNGSLFGSNIPASPVLGWVPVAVESQDGIRLGQTEIYYGDEEEDFLQQIVVNPSLQKRLFDKYNRYHSLGGNLETSGVDAQNYGTLGFKQPVQMLSHLVYAAAETDALQFIELIFSSSTGRLVFDAYKNNSTLPEVIAKDHGNEQTARYLKDVNKRFSEEIRNGKECSLAIDWSELAKAAEAAQKQHEITGHEKNYQIERDVPKETGYLGDVDTSSIESSEQQSSDSEDDISSKGPMFPEDDGLEMKNAKPELIDVKTQVEDVVSDVKDVKTKVTDVKTLVEGVGSDVKDMKTKVTDVKTQVEDDGSHVKDLKTEETDVKTQVEGVGLDVKDLKTEETDVKTQVEGDGSHVKDLKTEETDVKTQVEGVGLDVKDVKTEETDMKTQVEDDGSHVKDLKTEETDVKTQVEFVRSDVKDLKTEVTDVKTEVEDVGSDVKDLKTEVTDVKTLVEDVGSHVKDVKTEETDVKTQLEDVGLDVKDLKTEETDVKTVVEDAWSDVKDVKTEETDVKTLVEDVGSDVKDLKTEETDVKTLVEDVGSHVKDVKTEETDVKIQLEDVGLDVKDVKTEETDVKTLVEDVGLDVKDVKTEETDVKTLVEDVGSDVKDLKTEETDVKTLVEDVGSDVKDLKTEETDVKTLVEDVGSHVKDVKTEETDVKTELEDVESHVKDLKTEVTDVKAQVDDVRSDVKDVKTEVTYLLTQVKDFVSHLKELKAEAMDMEQPLQAESSEANEEGGIVYIGDLADLTVGDLELKEEIRRKLPDKNKLPLEERMAELKKLITVIRGSIQSMATLKENLDGIFKNKELGSPTTSRKDTVSTNLDKLHSMVGLLPFQDEQSNYFMFSYIVQDIFPKILRQAFKSRWDDTFGYLPGFQLWDDSTFVRNLFHATEGGHTSIPTDLSYEDWDCTALFRATISSRSLGSPSRSPPLPPFSRVTPTIEKHRTLFDLYVSHKRNRPSFFHASVLSPTGNDSETFALAIDQLRRLRNSNWNSPSSKMDKETFHQHMQYAKDAFKALGVTLNSTDTAGYLIKLNKEIRRELQKGNSIVLKEVEGHLLEIMSDIAQLSLKRQMDLKEAEAERKEELKDLSHQLQLAKDEFEETNKALIAAIGESIKTVVLKENLDDIFNNKELGSPTACCKDTFQNCAQWTKYPPFGDDQLNFFKITSIVIDEFPKALRQAFKSRWDDTFGYLPGFLPWNDSTFVRNLFRKTEGGRTRVPTHLSYEEWGFTSLFRATICARSFALPDISGQHRTLKDLYVKPRHCDERFHASVVSPEGNDDETFALAIDQLRLLRNSIHHSLSCKMENEEFRQYVQLAKDAFKALRVTTSSIDAVVGLSESKVCTETFQESEEDKRRECSEVNKFLQEDDRLGDAMRNKELATKVVTLPRTHLPPEVPRFTDHQGECKELTSPSSGAIFHRPVCTGLQGEFIEKTERNSFEMSDNQEKKTQRRKTRRKRREQRGRKRREQKGRKRREENRRSRSGKRKRRLKGRCGVHENSSTEIRLRNCCSCSRPNII